MCDSLINYIIDDIYLKNVCVQVAHRHPEIIFCENTMSSILNRLMQMIRFQYWWLETEVCPCSYGISFLPQKFLALPKPYDRYI